MIDRVINRHLHDYLHALPRWERLKLWHWNRVVYNQGPIFWTLAWIWGIPGFRWLYRLRCRNVAWRLGRHRRRRHANAPDLYTWARR